MRLDSGLKLFFLALVLASWGYWLFAWWCTRAFFRSYQEPEGDFTPPVSILKPLKGLDAGAWENFLSFIQQDYPQYQVLFGVLEPDDPNISLVERLREEWPQVDIQLIVAKPLGLNQKVSILHSLFAQARHPVLAISDSDMHVEREYLRRVVRPLARAKVGLVTCTYKAGETRNLPARLEALYVGGTFLPSVMVGRRYLKGFGLGATLVVRREDLVSLGGFKAIADYLADDYELGVRIASLGKSVHLSNYITETVLDFGSLRQVWHREVRWAKCIRVSQGWEYLGYLVSFTFPLALTTLVLSGLSSWGIWTVVSSLALRWAIAWLVSAETDDRQVRRGLLWLPVSDLVWFAAWCAAGVGRKVIWRGQAYRLGRGGVLEERVPSPTAQS